jgi:ATP-dependent helicase YprA (DUF1998 family)
VWQAVAKGRSGMLHATTGSGKTYAVWLGMLDALLRRHPHGRGAEPLRVVWLTPMRALASDTTKALAEPLRELAPNWTIRAAHRRHAQRRTRAPGPAHAHRAGDHARVADADAHARDTHARNWPASRTSWSTSGTS